MYKTRGGRTSERDKKRKETRAIGRKQKKKRMKCDIIHKLRRSVFGQILAVPHRLTTNNNNLM